MGSLLVYVMGAIKYYGLSALDIVTDGVAGKITKPIVKMGLEDTSAEYVFKGFSFLFTTSTWGTAKGIIDALC